MPSHLLFLFRYWKRFGDEYARSMSEHTLERIWAGGIHDHLGGGIARYSTDRQWLLPHFEKMLYDQALLLYVLAEFRSECENPLLAAFAEDIAGFVLREMASPEGGFYSAFDADSEGEEGRFYLWTEDQIRAVLSPEEAGIFICSYGVRKGGNVKNETTGRILGDNVLHLAEPFEKTASRFSLEQHKLEQLLASCRARLFDERKKRSAPLLDDKILTDWNGLMIAALARASSVFKRPEWLAAAEKAAKFVETKLRDRSGSLLHRYRDKEAAIPAFLDDHAFYVWGLVELAAASGKNVYTTSALKVADAMKKEFWDERNGGFFFSADNDPMLFLRRKEAYDGALPSGNAVATAVCIRLGALAKRKDFVETARRTAEAFSGQAAKYPLSHMRLLAEVMTL